MHQSLRLSRIRTPRGTLAAALLLAAVFIAFGLLISSLAPEQAATAPHFDGRALPLVNWLFGA